LTAAEPKWCAVRLEKNGHAVGNNCQEVGFMLSITEGSVLGERSGAGLRYSTGRVNMSVKLLIADDHKMLREGLRSVIEKEPGMMVVGEAENGKDTIAMAQKTMPNIILMDVAMPDLNGIEATRKIVKDNPRIRVVALSGHADRHFVTEMLKAGASAYILKQTACEELIRAIREVSNGKTYLSPAVTRGLVDGYVRSTPRKGENPAFATLTDREREVLQLIAEGQSTKEIADHVSVSVKTVETHRRNIMEKLTLHSVAELTKYAIREGITSLEN
jgi:DNA-binding NarL/FixJ family response regulator